MKTIDEQKATAREFFNRHIESGIMTEKDWNLFYLGWIETGYKLAYDEFEDYKTNHKKVY